MNPRKIALNQAVIVEGKYDKIRLESMIDALILPTDGFAIFKDKEMRLLIRNLANTCGIVVATDSDAAGFRIRTCIKEIAREGQVLHVYIPDILGKEKRKPVPGAEGKLGVEAMDTKSLILAFENAGITRGESKPGSRITKQDLYEAGLSGGNDSRRLRNLLTRQLNLPSRLSASSLPEVLSCIMSREDFFSMAEKICGEVEN